MLFGPLIAALAITAATNTLAAQENKATAPDHYAVTGYLGGMSALPKAQLYGMLILSDSGVSFHICKNYCTLDKNKQVVYDSIPAIFIPYAQMKEVAVSTQIKPSSGAARVAFGIMANDKREDMIGISYETPRRAESPVFSTPKAQSAAIEAQIRFLAKKAGSPIPPPK